MSLLVPIRFVGYGRCPRPDRCNMKRPAKSRATA